MKRTARLSGTFITVAALLVAPSPAPSEPRQQDATAIDAGTSIERHVANGEEHLYRITLTAGECAEVIVDQRGIDVVVRARREGGTDHVEFQEEVRRNGQEQVALTADEGGVYVVAIAPSHGVYSGTYAIRVAARRAATDVDRSMYHARELRTAALDLGKAARFAEARQLLERAITIGESVRGPDDVFVGMLLHDLVGVALETRDNARAEPLQRRALAIFESAWGAGHPYSAMARMRIAVLLHMAGQRAEAEALLRPATQLIENALGTEHAWFATCLRAQASIRYNARDLDGAEEVYRRAMAILEKVGANGTQAYMAILNNLGLIYMAKRDLERAEAHYRRALTLAQGLEGPESYHISLHLQNLGNVARERKDYATAIEYMTRALAMVQLIVGAEHVDIATVLNDLAIVFRLTGEVSRAADMFSRALRIVERNLGPYHRGTLTAVGNLAQLHRDLGDVSKAIPFQRRADAIIEKQLELNLAIGSERQKLAFVKGVSERTDRTLSLHLQQAADDAEAGALAALVVLQRKGRVLDAMTDAFATVRRRVDDGRGRAPAGSIEPHHWAAGAGRVECDTRNVRRRTTAFDSRAGGGKGTARSRARCVQRRAARADSAGDARSRPGGVARGRGLVGVCDLSPGQSEGRGKRRRLRATALRGVCRAQRNGAPRGRPRSGRGHRSGDRRAAAVGAGSNEHRRARARTRRSRRADAAAAQLHLVMSAGCSFRRMVRSTSCRSKRSSTNRADI